MTTPAQDPIRPVAWPVRTMRDENKLRLWVSVDSLMEFRNLAGAAGWPPPFLMLLDHIVREAQRADRYGRDIE
jgi:hypothetical protein